MYRFQPSRESRWKNNNSQKKLFFNGKFKKDLKNCHLISEFWHFCVKKNSCEGWAPEIWKYSKGLPGNRKINKDPKNRFFFSLSFSLSILGFCRPPHQIILRIRYRRLNSTKKSRVSDYDLPPPSRPPEQNPVFAPVYNAHCTYILCLLHIMHVYHQPDLSSSSGNWCTDIKENAGSICIPTFSLIDM